MIENPKFEFQLAEKSQKKDIQRFYRQHNYSAGFMGLDSCYLVKANKQIIACVIHSQLFEKNSQDLLHALLVSPNFRQQKIASRLINYSCTFHGHTVCFAEQTLAPLYLSLAFKPGKVEQLTTALANRYQQYLKSKPKLTIFIRGL